jgi:3-oxoacyl-(acyl-carrier-protein) synthase
MTAESIVITGVGVLSPLGLDVGDFWEAALAGRVGTTKLERFDTSRLSSSLGGEVRGLRRADPDAPLVVELATAAARAASDDAGLEGAGLAPERLGVCFGSVMATRPAVEYMATDRPAGALERSAEWSDPSRLARVPAAALGAEGPNCVVATACAAGNSALAYGADALRCDQADAMIVGGADELSVAMLLMFDSLKSLAPDAVRPFDRNRRGLLLAEGAAALVMEREVDAKARGAHPYGRLLACSNRADAHHMTAPHPDGSGAVRSLRDALQRADVDAANVDHLSAHGTGTIANDLVEAAAIRRVFGGHADSIPVSALKSMLGHTQGAASAIEAVGCLLAIRDGVAPPIANHFERDPACDLDLVVGGPRPSVIDIAVSTAFGFGGNIECAVFSGV